MPAETMRTQAQSHLNACEEGDKGVMHLISSRRENSITNCLVARGSVCVCVCYNEGENKSKGESRALSNFPRRLVFFYTCMQTYIKPWTQLIQAYSQLIQNYLSQDTIFMSNWKEGWWHKYTYSLDRITTVLIHGK